MKAPAIARPARPPLARFGRPRAPASRDRATAATTTPFSHAWFVGHRAGSANGAGPETPLLSDLGGLVFPHHLQEFLEERRKIEAVGVPDPNHSPDQALLLEIVGIATRHLR